MAPLTTPHSPLTTHHSPLTTHHSPLTTHHSPLTKLIIQYPRKHCCARNRPMLPISKMAAAVQPSATLAAGAKARQLKTEGKIVYDFSLGEPDFNTPKHICDAGYKAMLDGHTHYTAASGIAELRGAIARWYKKNYGYE